MNSPPLLDPQFTTAAAPAATLICTIMMLAAPTIDDYGADKSRAKQTYTVRPGHDAIQCVKTIGMAGSARATEERRMALMTMEWNKYDAKLLGYFPNISQTDQAVIDGVTYEIQGIDWDSQRALTNLHMRTLNV
jgi:hypothetical protein